MDDIFNRWLVNQLTQDDIIPIMLLYDSEFNDGKLTAQDCLMFLQHFQFPIGQFIDECMKQLTQKKNGTLVSVYKDGKLLKKFWYEGN